MSLRFDSEAFFDETVLPVTGDNAEYVKQSSVPLLSETLPVWDSDGNEHFTFHPCRLGYTPIGRTILGGIEVVSLEFLTHDKLPNKVATSCFKLPKGEHFDAVAIGKSGLHQVAGLHKYETQEWQIVKADRITAKNLIYAIKGIAFKPDYRNMSNSHRTSLITGNSQGI